MKDIYILESLDDTSNLANKLAKKILSNSLPKIILIQGNLGSGKTTFSQYFAKSLGVKNNLTSPTFVIMKSYDIPNYDFKLHHLDLYRLEKEWELEELEILSQIQTSNDIFLIEWADKFPTIFINNKKIILHFELQSENTRIITLELK